MFKYIKSCRVCCSTKLKPYLDFGDQPLANSFGKNPNKYELKVVFCEECNLSQLSVVVNPKILYNNYPYCSSISKTFQNHCSVMAMDIKEYFDFKDPLVIDIASNDGCLLQEFKKEGYYTMGVEPAKNLAKKANDNGINTIEGFWSREVASRLPACDVITATNVFAHVDDIRQFVDLVRGQLRVFSKGMFVIEVPYLPSMIEGNAFDTIYHEHLSYFLLKPLKRVLESCGLNVFRVDKLSIHGGSIRVYSCPYSRKIDDSVDEILKEEQDHGYYDFKTYLNFSNNVEQTKRDIRVVLENIYEECDVVMGYGASAKGINLLNMCDINPKWIHSIVDETPEKQGTKCAGLNIPIVPFDNFNVVCPDYIMLLAWNFSKELISKTKSQRADGADYIIPIPRPVIV